MYPESGEILTEQALSPAAEIAGAACQADVGGNSVPALIPLAFFPTFSTIPRTHGPRQGQTIRGIVPGKYFQLDPTL